MTDHHRHQQGPWLGLVLTLLPIKQNKKDYVEYFFPLPPDKKLNSKEERQRADPAYEIMESRGAERNPEVGELKK